MKFMTVLAAVLTGSSLFVKTSNGRSEETIIVVGRMLSYP